MNELTICDHFKWSLDSVRELTINEYKMIEQYFKKLEREQKRQQRKMKSSRGKRR